MQLFIVPLFKCWPHYYSQATFRAIQAASYVKYSEHKLAQRLTCQRLLPCIKPHRWVHLVFNLMPKIGNAIVTACLTTSELSMILQPVSSFKMRGSPEALPAEASGLNVSCTNNLCTFLGARLLVVRLLIARMLDRQYHGC